MANLPERPSMRRHLRTLGRWGFIGGVCLMLSACRTAEPPQPPPIPLDAAAQRRVDVEQQLQTAFVLVEAGRTDEAEKMIQPYVGDPAMSHEIKLLQREIAMKRRESQLERDVMVSRNQAIGEVRERLVLPETYGETRVISPTTGPFDFPPGVMEDLVNSRFTLDVDSAQVSDIVMALSKHEGMNIIADEALQGNQSLSIHVKNVPLKDLLSYISRNMGVSFYFGENMIWVTKADDTADTGPQLETRIIRLSKGYIPANPGEQGDGGGATGGFAGETGTGDPNDDLLTSLNDFIVNAPDKPVNSELKIYRNRNIMVMRDTRERIRAAQDFVDHFDKTPQQVLIEARFLTINQDELFQLGTSINSILYSGAKEIRPEYSSPLPAFSNLIGGSPQLAVSGIIDNLTYEAVIQALDKRGNSKTLSAPRVTVLNNQSAEIRRGDKRYYFKEFEQESSGGDNPVVSTVPSGEAEELDLGITLRVKPSVGNDSDTITMGLYASIIDFIEFTELSPGVVLPRTNENILSTIVAVNSGQTLVMGGQLTNEETTSTSKVPLLGDLPVVGYLFKKKETNKVPSHLLIFVKATVIDPDGRLNLVAKPVDNDPAAAPVVVPAP